MSRRRSFRMTGVSAWLAVAALASAASAVVALQAGHPGVVKATFGHVGGDAVEVYTLTNAHGIEVRVMTYGAAIVSLKTPDRSGRLGNIVLGFDTLEPYLAGVPYYGATVGRYANRIAAGQLSIDGSTHQLAKNDGSNTLHGGAKGFDKRLWKAESLAGTAVRMTYVSPAGEEGFPGQLTARVTYRLSDDDSLSMEYEAVTTAPTVVNLANHAYFNLTGEPDRPILDHLLTLDADRFTPVDSTLIPTGELSDVAGTPFDFRTPRTIGSRIGEPNEQLRLGHGYDHNWVLNARGPAPAAVLTDPLSGRSLEVRTTQPGVQFYSGNFLNGRPAGAGSVFGRRTGLCLETQHFPDSPHHPSFPSTLLRPGQIYSERTVLAFRVVR